MYKIDGHNHPDFLNMSFSVETEKDKFKKSENGSFLKTGEKEICIKCFKKKEDI